MAGCVWGWAARAPGPASACPHNLVVADILRMSVSSFVSTFAALYKRLSLFGNCRHRCKVLERPKNTWWPAAVNLTRQIAAMGVAATIDIGRRGLGGGRCRRTATTSYEP
jgi:hypothetical protein